MILKKVFLLLFFFPTICFSENIFSCFDVYQEKLSRSEIEEKMKTFLQKDPNIYQYFTINDDVFTLYNLPETQENRKVDYSLKLLKQAEEKTVFSQNKKDLVGVRIAIDPGHLGGLYARLEERYVAIPPSLERAHAVQFDEGTLSYLTALYLKILLEKKGAIVLLTRNKIGQSVYSESFFDWLKKNPEFWSGEVSLSHLFRKYYNPLDLHARAKKINAFKPDLTIVVHYNSHYVKEAQSSNHTVTSTNYNLVFIPGSFFRSELSDVENRFEFLRLLLTDDLYHSLSLSRSILKQFIKKLEIPVVTKNDGAHYLDRVCLQLDEGVYARNLALTRLVHGPICYGETLIQNNIDECLNLSRTDFFIHGRPCSSRIKQVAEAYFEGIKEYLLEKK